MEKHPAATAFNMRLGSLIKDVSENQIRLAIVYECKQSEGLDCRLDYLSYKLQYLTEDKVVGLSFANKQGFYPYMLVVSY